MNKQQEYINKLKEISLVPIQIANLTLKPNGEYKPGCRYNTDKYDLFDERNVFINEIVFDFDWASYSKNYSKAVEVIEALENRKMPYYIFATGGKGVHIHTFFNKLVFDNAEQKEIIKQATMFGFGPKNIRLWLWNTILDEACIEEKYRKKYIDNKPIKFDYSKGTSHLIRACGGRKIFKNSDGNIDKNYKTFLPKNEFTDKKVIVSSFEQVRFPETVEAFNIDIEELCVYLKKFNKHMEDINEIPLKNQYLNINYREIDGVLKIVEGLSEGSRNLGSLVIATACKIDRLPKKDAVTLLKQYVANCSQVGHKFGINEAEQWLDWVYSQEYTFWTCSQLIDLGVHDEAVCEFCLAKNKDANKLLVATNMLQQIKEVLDLEIIGEEGNKMLMFLLLLSKDFPSDTGLPGWNIPGDPMSQNVILASDSSSGKTYVAKNVLKLFGNEGEDYHIISRMSKSVINYYTEENMDGKIIFVEEMQGLDENTSQLRVWMSEGKLNFDSVEKTIDDNGIERNNKVKRTTKGQPCFLTCQAEGKIEDQLNNRSWLLSCDVSSNQTKKILKYQTELNEGKLKFSTTKLRIIQDALKQLKPYHFLIDFLDEDFMNIPVDNVRSRRDYIKFITLIKCVAYLHQKQREIVEIDSKEFIKCSIEDYDIARQYSHNILGATFTGLTVQQIDVLQHIKNEYSEDDFTVYDLQRAFDKSHTYWHNQMSQLVELGFVRSEKAIGKNTVFNLNSKKAINIVELPSGKELQEHRDLKKKNELCEKNEILDGSKNEVFHTNFEKCLSVSPKVPNSGELRVETLNIFPIHVRQKWSQKNDEHFLIAESGNRLRSKDVLEYIVSSNEHLVKICDIKQHFNNNIDIDSIILQLKKEGEIVEPKNGVVMLV